MVKSFLNSAIDYPEHKTLFEEDRNFYASMYKVDILDTDVIVALGQAKYTYADNNVIYYPIYLVKYGKVNVQIGIYEIAMANAAGILDDDGDVDINLMGEPVLYPFVSKAVMSDEVVEEEEADEGMSDVAAAAALNEQTLEDALKEKEGFKDDKSLVWIQRYMKNNNYKIVDNEGKGDCLFAAIRDGLKMVGINTSVADMRKIVAENATNIIYLNYKTLYEKALEEDKIISKEIKILADRHNDLKKQIKVEKDRNTQLAIIEQAEEIGKRHKDIKQDRANVRSMIEEFKFIKGIKDVDMFKLKIQTCDFWGDTWALSTLERALKIKLILMSRANFKEDDLDNVLTCGQLNDDEGAGSSSTFNPEFYIILDYSGAHYQLITYKDHGAFKFSELPYDIKRLVVDKCLERQAGPYYKIPDFKTFMEKMNLAVVEPIIKSSEMQSDLYDNATIFQFYSKSVDKPKPGKGSGETIGPEGTAFYNELTKIPLWRRKLSNFWESEFTLDGKKWLSVEHYYQGSKYKRNEPNFYAQFSLDSGSAISKDVAMSKSAGGKSGKYKGELVRPKGIIMDKDFFEMRENGMTRANLEMQAAMMAKFSQNEELKRLLKATKKAKLNHFSRGSPPVLFTDLMIVRNKKAQQEEKEDS
jgi:hypothetical protein